MRPSPRAALLALVPLGTIAGHAAGYVLAGQDAGLDGSHSHLRPGTWLAAAAAVAALGWVAAARGARHARLPVAWLAAGQAALFLGLESAEDVAGGHSLGHLLAQPALRWGLLGQLATAGALVLAARLARASGDRVRALLAAPRRPVGRSAPAVRPGADATVRSLILASSASERGPPRILVSV